MLQNTIVMSSFEQQWQSIVSVFSAPKNAQIRALQVNYRDLNLFRSGHKPAVNILFILIWESTGIASCDHLRGCCVLALLHFNLRVSACSEHRDEPRCEAESCFCSHHLSFLKPDVTGTIHITGYQPVKAYSPLLSHWILMGTTI